jgi:hypothetical protein
VAPAAPARQARTVSTSPSPSVGSP